VKKEEEIGIAKKEVEIGIVKKEDEKIVSLGGEGGRKESSDSDDTDEKRYKPRRIIGHESIKIFNKETDPQLWIASLRLCRELYGWKNREFTTVILTKLDPYVWSLIQSTSKLTSKSNPERLLEYIMVTYGPKISRPELFKKIQEIKQSKSQNVRDLITLINTVALRYDPNFNIRSEEGRSFIETALLPEYLVALQRHQIANPNLNYDEFLKFSHRSEAVLRQREH